MKKGMFDLMISGCYGILSVWSMVLGIREKRWFRYAIGAIFAALACGYAVVGALDLREKPEETQKEEDDWDLLV